MKTAEEVLNKEYYKELHKGYSFDIGNYNREVIIEAMKEYATEVAKKALKNASLRDGCTFGDGERYVHHGLVISETNIPKLD